MYTDTSTFWRSVFSSVIKWSSVAVATPKNYFMRNDLLFKSKLQDEIGHDLYVFHLMIQYLLSLQNELKLGKISVFTCAPRVEIILNLTL